MAGMNMNSEGYAKLIGDFLRANNGFDELGELTNTQYENIRARNTSTENGGMLIFSHIPKEYPATMISTKEANECYLSTQFEGDTFSHPITLDPKLSVFAARNDFIFGITRDARDKPLFFFAKDDLLLEQYIDAIEFRLTRLGAGEDKLSTSPCLFLSFNNAYSLVNDELISDENFNDFLTVNQEFLDFYKQTADLFSAQNTYILDLSIPYSVSKACVYAHHFDKLDDIDYMYEAMAENPVVLKPSPIARVIYNLPDDEKNVFVIYQTIGKSFRIYQKHDEYSERIIDTSSRDYFNRCLATGHFTMKAESSEEQHPYEALLLNEV